MPAPVAGGRVLLLALASKALMAATSAAMTNPLPQIQLLEKIVALVVDDDEGGEILHLDAPDRLHAELGIFHGLDLLDAVLGEVGRTRLPPAGSSVSSTADAPGA